MMSTTRVKRWTVLAAVAGVMVLAAPARAHCDAENGPVAAAARDALDTGQFDGVAIWVGEEQEAELRAVFDRSLPAYRMGGAAETLAEEHFMAEAVRLHRAAEGMPYTGLKAPRALPEDIAAAEQALETGDASLIVEPLQAALEANVTRWLNAARAARQHREQSVEAGREFVDAYVKYVIYVHGLHKTIEAGPAHGVGEDEH